MEMTPKNASADLVVVGSGLGGMIAAVRAHDQGLRVIMIEKSHHYGGTSALSGGGVWIPVHSDVKDEDTREKALAYMQGVTQGRADSRKLEAYVDKGSDMIDYARSIGLDIVKASGYPDYFSERDDALSGRTLLAGAFDGRLLGEEFFQMRTTYRSFLAFNRYSMNLGAVYSLLNRRPGWLKEAFKLVAGYWVDLGWRRKTARDSRLSMGQALVGAARKAMIDRDIPLLLSTSLTGIVREDGRISGVRVKHNGNSYLIQARSVMLASGGFEQNQAMRDKYHKVKTDVAHSLTPEGANTGDGIVAGQEIGADLENMDQAWWAPIIRLPGPDNKELAAQVFFDRGRPGIISVNRLGKRFCNEAISYDRFGHAMMEDEKKTGANLPCWLIFDAKYRQNYPISDLLPGWIRPDKSLPREFWDNVIYRADTIADLARKIDVDPASLQETVTNVNRFALSGKDLEFSRGETDYDRFFGDPGTKPCSNLRPLDHPPFYAVKMELGDIGTKGGLRTDEFARVLDLAGKPIEGLYATGNTAGSLFLDVYPGAGSTLGPAMVFGYIGADHAASMLTNALPSQATRVPG